MSRLSRTAAAAAAASLLTTAVALPASASAEQLEYHSPSTSADGEVAYFAGFARGKGVELFKTDGTDAGTTLVKDIAPGAASSLHGETPERNAARFTSIGDRTFFEAQTADLGRQLWVTDGSAAGTVTLTSEIPIPGFGGAAPTDLTPFGGLLYFAAVDEERGKEVWTSDGTPAGTRLAFDIRTTEPAHRAPGSFPHDFTQVGDLLYFVASATGREDLYVTDGDDVEVALSIDPADGSFQEEGQLVEHDGRLAFVLQRGSARDIWVTDGTPAGTERIVANSGIRFGEELVSFDGALYYRVSGDTLRRVVPGSAPTTVSTAPAQGVAVHGDRLWFLTYSAGTRLGVLHAVAPGGDAVRVADVYRSSRRTETFDTAYADGVLYLIANGSLIRSDGTEAGTRLVQSLGMSRNTASHSELAVAGDHVVLAVRDRLEVGALWLSDGTSEGTYQRMPQRTFTGATPRILGTATVGETLRGHVGTWTPKPAGYRYQWYANGSPIEGATAKSYTLTADEAADTVTLVVTGSAPGFKSLKRESAAKLVRGTFTSAPVPTISGTVAAGELLTAVPGSWTPAATFEYQWFADGKAIKGRSTSASYKVTSTSQYKQLQVRVTGLRPDTPAVQRMSEPVTRSQAR
ncbi:hypothetical protein [Homoserinibacter sp. YIM 151385]|uniref:hypothetical protein n=1 Tax=Homoserinibacter sp. YIM 151385 TaxID=2985506 RepID=UPI0022F0736E|nr:hypothetical protein [Homoserinibacter sp. YIM 151385]WBU36949.1 hypothetical protein OF852_08400 [Homoserinibacter sp. YIM 151385]